MTAITAVGAYVPRFRISAEAFEAAWGQFQASGVNRKAVPAADEDTLTMAYEAATRALRASETDPTTIDWLGVASSRPTEAEEDLTSRLGAMLAIPKGTSRQLFVGSTRAGTRALWGGEDALNNNVSSSLVVIADAPRGDPDDGIDHAAGAGAAAFILEHTGPVEIVDRAEYSLPYPGTRFRATGENETQELGITHYNRQAFTETISGAIAGLESEPEPDAAVIQAPDGKMPYRVAGTAGIGVEEIQAVTTVHDFGDLGAASVPISLATALKAGYNSILAVSHGSGAGADAFVIDVNNDVSIKTDLERDDEISYIEYLRQRGVVTTGPPAGGGAYVSVPSWKRSIPQRYNLKAGRCSHCSALSFPPEGACTTCGTLSEYELLELPGSGTIEAVTTISQGGAPPEFAEQQARSGDYAAAIVALETESGDESVSIAAMGTDAAPDEFSIGDPIETTIRRIYTQEGVTRYGFKIRPLTNK